MIETWLAASTLTLLAATFLIAGSRRGRRLPPATDAASAFATRRRELRAEAQAQGLESSTIEALEEELALDEIDHANDAQALVCTAALGESSSSEITAESPSAPPLLPLGLGALAIALVSLALYALWGEPYASTLAEAKAALDRTNAGDQALLPELEQALASRTRRKPEDSDGWYFLGHARMRMEDYRGAVNAFTELRSRIGTNAQVDLALAQAHYMMDGGTMTEATRTLVRRALASNPQQLDLLELLVTDALHRSDYLVAARHLVTALGQAMPAPRREVLRQALALARARLDPKRPYIEATIHAEDLSAPWLMVFARPVGGGAPLAAMRLPTQATQTVVLDAAASMNDAWSQSSGALVEVVARTSHTGSATAAEAEAISEPVDATQHPSLTLTFATLVDSASR